jgi:hypothetical protein
MIKHHVKEREKAREGFPPTRGRARVQPLEEREAIKQGSLPLPETRSFTGHKLQQGDVVKAAR